MTTGVFRFEKRAIAQGVVLGALLVGSVACSSSDDKTSDNSGATDGGGTGDDGGSTGETEQGLSKAFLNNCARCHGQKGEGAGAFPTIPGDLSESEFIATVRAGTSKGMPAFAASKISDDDLKADYVWLTTKR